MVRATISGLAVMLKPIEHGWAVILTDGLEPARFTGLGAKARATCYMVGCKASRLSAFGRRDADQDRTKASTSALIVGESGHRTAATT